MESLSTRHDPTYRKTLKFVLLFWNLWLFDAFVVPTTRSRNRQAVLTLAASLRERPKEAYLLGVSKDSHDYDKAIRALRSKGFQIVDLISDQRELPESFVYKYKKATGLLQLVSSPKDADPDAFPRWVPLVNDMESVLSKNGWSFLDPDESEPMSAFDVDAANMEGTYRPKWGHDDSNNRGTCFHLSSMGFDLAQIPSSEIFRVASSLQNEQSRLTLLEGATDPSGTKVTCDGHDFSGATGQSDIPQGVFCTAIGLIPVFSSLDLSPTTSSSGWLTFTRPIAEDHIVVIEPGRGATDQRIEVLCSKSKCHLGHFFGADGFCINASALCFIREDTPSSSTKIATPVSWRCLDDLQYRPQQQIRSMLLDRISTKTLVIGAGCFWHVESALRRLPGVINTRVGFAGGVSDNPTYTDVCHMDTGHAEVVLVEYDALVLPIRTLVDAFLALHNPTKVRSHGKHISGTGQYRSLLIAPDTDTVDIVTEALTACSLQLRKELSIQVKLRLKSESTSFFEAEECHQRQSEKRSTDVVNISTLPFPNWLQQYGRRASSIEGSAESVNLEVHGNP